MSEHGAEIAWERGGAKFTDSKYSRSHRWRFDGGVEVPASASPAIVPGADPAGVDPEEAFVASLASCHMLWFLSLSAKRGLVVERYRDAATGALGAGPEGRKGITRVTLHPVVEFAGPERPSAEEHEALHREAHERCFIAASVRTEVLCEPAFAEGSRSREDRAIARPKDDEYADYYRPYIARVPDGDILGILEGQIATIRSFGALVPAARETFAYAPGKWSVRQVFGHLGDSERVFGYRAFCIARGDQTPLPGFDENEYVERSRAGATPLRELIEEIAALRQANVRMLGGLADRQWTEAGTANGFRISVRALAHVMAGHLEHHLGVLRERYGVPAGR